MASITEAIRSRRVAVYSGVHRISGLSGLVSGPILQMASSTTAAYNRQLRQKLDYLKSFDESYKQEVKMRLKEDPNYRGSRDKGVNQAWAYEKAELEFGGRGSRRWTRREREEILRTGKLQGAEAHHQKNVANHPEDQANPDNFKFYRSREEHLKKGHKGDWQNESDAKYVDRTARVKRANTRRVVKNEIKAAGLSTIIPLATTASMAFIIEMAKGNSSSEDFKRAFFDSLKVGAKSAGIQLVCYGTCRLVINPLMNTISTSLARHGIQIGAIGRQLVGMGIAGAITIGITSIFMYVSMRKAGLSVGESFKTVIINASVATAFTIATGALVAILRKGQYSNHVTTIVTVAVAIVMFVGQLSYELYKVNIDNKTAERIDSAIMGRYYPQISMC